MPRLAPPSLLLLLLTGCVAPVPPGSPDDAERLRAEAARARFRSLQEQHKPTPLPDFVPVRLHRGPHSESGIKRTGSETLILVPRLP